MQYLKSKLKETQEKLDRLVSLYLDGDIERELYLKKKDLLLRQKANLEERMRVADRPGQSWLEPYVEGQSFILELVRTVDYHSENIGRNTFWGPDRFDP